jgi:hypothetical protein
VGKTICEKTSLLPGSCASPGHLPALGVSRLPHLPADAYWERLTDCLRPLKATGLTHLVVLEGAVQTLQLAPVALRILSQGPDVGHKAVDMILSDLLLGPFHVGPQNRQLV